MSQFEINFEYEEMLKNKLKINDKLIGEIEERIENDKYALYNALSALAFYKNKENNFFKLRKINKSNSFIQKISSERSYANSSIIGIFKILEMIKMPIQEFPSGKINNNVLDWKILFFSIGEYISEIDIKKIINDNIEISSFNISEEQLDISGWITKDFKKKSFIEGLELDFYVLDDLLKNIEKYCNRNMWRLGTIADFDSFIKFLKKHAKLNKIGKKYIDSIILDLDKNDINSFRPSIVQNNPVLKPIIKKGNKVFLSSTLLKYSRESYYQIFCIWSFPFGHNINSDLKNNIAEKYSSLYSKRMVEEVHCIANSCGYIVHESIPSSTWNRIDNSDLGDIDAVIVNDNLKIVLVNEIKYKKKHFYNLNSRYKTEQKWLFRQLEREKSLIDYCMREYKGYRCYVNIITMEPITYNSRKYYFNNIVINALHKLLTSINQNENVALKEIFVNDEKEHYEI